jgi:hypothetical protein
MKITTLAIRGGLGHTIIEIARCGNQRKRNYADPRSTMREPLSKESNEGLTAHHYFSKVAKFPCKRRIRLRRLPQKDAKAIHPPDYMPYCIGCSGGADILVVSPQALNHTFCKGKALRDTTQPVGKLRNAHMPRRRAAHTPNAFHRTKSVTFLLQPFRVNEFSSERTEGKPSSQSCKNFAFASYRKVV